MLEPWICHYLADAIERLKRPESPRRANSEADGPCKLLAYFMTRYCQISSLTILHLVVMNITSCTEKTVCLRAKGEQYEGVTFARVDGRWITLLVPARRSSDFKFRPN